MSADLLPGLIAAAWHAAEARMLEPGQSVESRAAARSLFRVGAVAMLRLLQAAGREPAEVCAHIVADLEAEIALMRASDPHLLPVTPGVATAKRP